MKETLLFWGVTLLAMGGSVVCLWQAHKRDLKNYIVQKATPLPIRLINVHDDVWLRGAARCSQLVTAPWFHLNCLHYEYKLEERVKRGKDYSWVERKSESGTARFAVEDATGTIQVAGDQAEYDGLSRQQQREGSFRHTVHFLPYPCTISVVGCTGEGKKILHPYENIPLIVSTRERADYFKYHERVETALRVAGFVLLFGSFSALIWKLAPILKIPGFSTGSIGWAMGAAAVLAAPFWLIHVYNRFAVARNRVENAWRQIDVDLRMRHELIPNLVAAVQGYMNHEKDMLERLTAIRAQAAKASGISSQVEAEGLLGGALGKFLVAAERYPDLKASPQIQHLMAQLTALEDKLAHGRAVYNEIVTEYHTMVMTFPRNLIAPVLGFREYQAFQPSEGAPVDRAPQLQLQ
ncbi:MAG: hypothetical protein GMKNLPBB_03052 [Myxococcota bacterium]|nr:hypothetical protein [Myxococcota bacterium]